MATADYTPQVDPATMRVVNHQPPRIEALGDDRISLPAMIAFVAIIEDENIEEYCRQRGIRPASSRLALYELERRNHITVMWETVYPNHEKAA